MKSQIVQASGQSVGLSAPWPIHSLRVDNQSNQWYRLTGTFQFFAPYTFGAVAQVSGLGAIELRPEAPTQTPQAAVKAGEQYIATLYSDVLAESPGIYTPPAVVPFVALSVYSFGVTSGGAGTQKDVLTGGGQTVLENLGGVKRMLIKAQDTNAAKVWVGVFDVVKADSSGMTDLAAGASIVIPYRWWSSTAPAGSRWGQLWFDGAADLVRCTAVI